MIELAKNVWRLPFPLALLGSQIGRNVTIIRLASGKLVLHSTAPFSDADRNAIRTLGSPAWLVEATLFHDTCARSGREAFPEIPYLAPETSPAFPNSSPLLPAPPDWDGELDVIELEGMPRVREHVLFHRPSATLIVADLFFNLQPVGWTRIFMRAVSGLKSYPGMSRLFRFMIKDREAFRASLERVRALPFERIVVAHGEPISTDARGSFDAVLAAHGF